MKGSAITAVLLMSALTTVAAMGPIYVAVDVPSRLGNLDYTPHQLVRDDADLYALEAELPADVAVGAVYREPGGSWLFAPRDPVTLGQDDYEPRDLVSWDGDSYTPKLKGSEVGIPAGIRIDAVFVDAGVPVLSFDVPVFLGQTDYGRSDLVSWDGNEFSEYWNAAAAEVPETANLVGAELDEMGDLVLAFDEPTDLGQTTFLNGQLVRWGVNGFEMYDENPEWPPSSRLRDFALAPLAGAVPGSGADALRVSRGANPGELTLTWGTSCDADDGDYVVYEGTLGGEFSDHAPALCSTGGATSASLEPKAGDRYFLVAPRNALTEGSYGLDSAGSERRQSTAACLPRALGGC